MPEFKNIIAIILLWNEKYALIPQEIRAIISEEQMKIWAKNVSGNASSRIGSTTSHSSLTSCQAILPLFSLKAKINYLLEDSEFRITHLTELAFEHLRRSIRVDEGIREKWKSVWDKGGEVDFEKLGALHLLSHGIWAFKINGERERTDLVCQEPLDHYIDAINRAAQGLVITEWKIASSENDIKNKAQEAKKQISLYSRGVLSGLELRKTRYVVLVSKKEPNTFPKDEIVDGICYRYIVIATDPDTPSVQAQTKRKAEKANLENA